MASKGIEEVCPSCFGTNTNCRVCAGTFPFPERPPAHARVIRSLESFATAEYPLHPSQITKMVECPWRAAMQHMFEEAGDSGPAADTGSACHAAVAAWHTMGKDAGEAVQRMVERSGEFPRADLEEATAMFLNYTRDPRNREAEVVAVEIPVSFRLPPAPEDPTKAFIEIVGRVDQVRRDVTGLHVFDLKTSKRPGRDLLDEHVYQVACYCVGASHHFGQPIGPGSLICPRHYRRDPPPESRPDGVFFPFPWTFADVRSILWGVRRIVAAIRMGEVWHKGGDHCRWCPAGSTDVCLPRLRSVQDPRTMRISLPVQVATGRMDRLDTNIFEEL